MAALVDLAPDDEAAIEAATLQLLREAASQPDAFYERSARSLQRIGEKLQVSQGGNHAASLARLRGGWTRSAPRRRSDADRAACRALLTPAAKASA